MAKKGTKVQIENLQDIYQFCAGIDVHKAGVTVCAICGEGAQREAEVVEYGTTTAELRQLGEWLREQGVTHVVMESTGVYWRPVWQILETAGFHLLLANAKQVRNVPGRKTDQSDSIWLATLLRKGLIRGSFIPSEAIRALRDLCRSRASLVRDRTRIVQRIEKVLEEGNVKLDVVASDIVGVSGHRMLERLAQGETDTVAMAELAVGKLRKKIPQLIQALEGSLRPHQLFLLRELLEQYDYLCKKVERFERQIEEYAGPFEEQIERLDAVPGINRLAATAILSEIGVDMSRFPTPQQLCKWATVCPGNRESAGQRKSGKTGRGNRWLRGTLTQCSWAASHDKESYLAAQYRRLLHRGKQRALVAVAHSILNIIWHLLQHQIDYQDLGVDYFERQNLEGKKRAYVKKLEKLGFTVKLEPAA
jgi:transposase